MIEVELCRRPSEHLRQDGDAEALAGVGGPQIDGQLGEKPPGGLSFHPARQLGAVPEARREILDLDQRGERERQKGRREKTNRRKQKVNAAAKQGVAVLFHFPPTWD